MTIGHFFIFLFSVQAFIASSQTRWAFTFSDTSFNVKQTHRIFILYKTARPDLDTASKPSIDSIVNFLNLHKNLAIEIAVHGKSVGCMAITTARSKAIVDTLVAQGIDKQRLLPKGYGETRPLIPDFEIKKAKTKEEKEMLMSLNRRTEIIIRSTDFGR